MLVFVWMAFHCALLHARVSFGSSVFSSVLSFVYFVSHIILPLFLSSMLFCLWYSYDIVPTCGKRVHRSCLQCQFCMTELTKKETKLRFNKLCCTDCIKERVSDPSAPAPAPSSSSASTPTTAASTPAPPSPPGGPAGSGTNNVYNIQSPHNGDQSFTSTNASFLSQMSTTTSSSFPEGSATTPGVPTLSPSSSAVLPVASLSIPSGTAAAQLQSRDDLISPLSRVTSTVSASSSPSPSPVPNSPGVVHSPSHSSATATSRHPAPLFFHASPASSSSLQLLCLPIHCQRPAMQQPEEAMEMTI